MVLNSRTESIFSWDAPLQGTLRPHMHAFEQQLMRAASTPKVPEWEEIAVKLKESVESMVLGHTPPDSALRALDRDVDRMLEKRRWLLTHRHAVAAAGTP